jgi:hypothetical protein
MSELRSQCFDWPPDYPHLENCTCLFVVVTLINPEGETGYMWLEHAERIGDGNVALTEPMGLDGAIDTLIEMKAERDNERQER